MTDPDVTLEEAEELLNYSDPSTAGLWPRAVALLGRQALEGGLRMFWMLTAPQVVTAGTRAQLLCLADRLPKEAVGLAHQTWAALSRACHHHLYELAPTSGELQAWLRDVRSVLDELQLQTRRTQRSRV